MEADLARFVEGIVHEPTQTDDSGLDLTVAAVHEVTEPGRVDFGGGELEPAETEPHPSEKRAAEDDYEWWHLDAGQYVLEYNESVAAGARQRIYGSSSRRATNCWLGGHSTRRSGWPNSTGCRCRSVVPDSE